MLDDILSRKVSHVVVFAQGKCLGVSNSLDAEFLSGATLFQDLVHRPPDNSVSETTTLEEFGRLFSDHTVDAQVVHDSQGEYVGVVTRQSLLETLLKEHRQTEITDHKQTEQGLQLSAEVMENMAEGVCLVRASDGCLVFTNPRFEQIFGYSPGELTGKHTAILNAPGEKKPKETAETILQDLEKRGVWSGEIHNIRKDGTPFWTHSSVSTFEHSQHGTVRVAVVEDITDRKQAEEEAQKHRDDLAHVTRVYTMGEMTTGIAHELNQPLAAIASYTFIAKTILEELSPTSPTLQDTLVKLEEQVIRAGGIVRQLRNFLKKKKSTREPVELNSLIENVAKFVVPDILQAQVVLELKTDDSSPSVLVDEVQIQQVLVNLIRNAIDAMQEMPTSQRKITVSTQIQDGHAEVTVSDLGEGLADDEFDQAFQAFFSTKQEGMGLAISRSIIESHEGKIWAKPNIGPGVTFGFNIPLENGQAH